MNIRGIIAAGTILVGTVIGGPEVADRLSSPPPPPEFLVDHDDKGVGLDDGPTVGASSYFPRPEELFKSQGIDYEYAQTPNVSQRGQFATIEGIVLHVTGPGSMDGMKSWFKNPASGASAHFGVGKDGSIDQYAELADATWHAGIYNNPDLTNQMIARWWAKGRNEGNPNRFTVGIEVLLAPGERIEAYPKQQESLYKLMAWVSDVTKVPLNRTQVIGHYQVDAVNRSVDPRCCMDIETVISGAVAMQKGSSIEDLICSYDWDCKTAIMVFTCESGLNPNATGRLGERGIAQIHPIHQAQFDWARAYEPKVNLDYAYKLQSSQGWSPWSCYKVACGVADGQHWNGCVDRWFMPDGWSYSPDEDVWYDPAGVKTWEGCTDYGARYNIPLDRWFLAHHAYDWGYGWHHMPAC